MRLLAISGLSILIACGSGGSSPATTDGGGSGGSGSGGSGSGGSGGSGSGGSGSGGSGGSGGGGDASIGSTGTSPIIGGCDVFPADSPWNTRIDDPAAFPLDPKAATYAASMAPAVHLHADWGNLTPDYYGIPWQAVPSTQAMVALSFPQGSDQSDLGPYPIPANALIEGGPGGGGDQHVLVLQSGSCVLYELYQGAFTNPGWSCSSAAKFDLSSNTLRPDGWTSADAAGLPIMPGLVKLKEVQAGAIQHAIRFTMVSTQQAYIHPATHAAGKADATLPPMGLRLRLKASVDISKLTGPSLILATALKRYGIILADNGSDWFLSGDSDNGWTNLIDTINGDLKNLHGSDFEAVKTGAVSTAGL